MEWLGHAIEWMANQVPPETFLSYTFNIKATLAILFTCLLCGCLGGLVVGNRMAFFSDALAHCAFAGIALGLCFFMLFAVTDQQFRDMTMTIMIVFGIVVGLLIAWVRERTNLASDTVIGVFFAFAIGIGAVCMNIVSSRRKVFDIEAFIFGDPLVVRPHELVYLAILFIVTVVFLLWYYNDLILMSVHPSLALSRNVRVRLLRYLLIVLLGIHVNLCLWVVGSLLINGLLIVPAAAAANLARNVRQLFWSTLAISLVSGLGGQWLSWEVGRRYELRMSTAGTILVLCCLFFFATLAVRSLLRGRSGLATSA